MIAGGRRLNKEEFLDLRTQTVNMESVFTLLALSSFEKRKLAVIDVKGACLNADIEAPGGRNTFLKLDPMLTELFVDVDQNLRSFVRKGGSLIMRIDKALYGTLQASYLWQTELTLELVKLNFCICTYDKCVAINRHSSIILGFHVDDLLVCASSHGALQGFIERFGKVFTITKNTGTELDY